jgi:PhoD-like phosphatase
VPRLLLGPLLRFVDECSATVWVETSGPATIEVLGHTASTFSVGGRHYGLVIVEGLSAGSEYEYDVMLDGESVWPEAGSEMPPSAIRTPAEHADVRIVVGSCRAAAPHEEPYSLERALDDEGRGIDTLWAHARRMLGEPRSEWPDLLLFIGDQIYADDSSPGTEARLAELRGDDHDLPPEIVANFEEYCWLYHEAWSLPYERWLLSTVPSAMIFDDHDMIDDWNISESWALEQRREPWWPEHATGSLVSYWIYQHLGNLSPDEIRRRGMLERLTAMDDATDELRRWAEQLDGHDEHTVDDRFSFVRSVGRVTIVVIDCRHGRLLHGDTRLMVGPDEWQWICERAEEASEHVVLATSVPVFIADGLHDFQVWSERVCGGAWGRRAATRAEKLRRELELEDWSAFGTSYSAFVELVGALAARPDPPASMIVASGDIHYSYVARVPLPNLHGRQLWQVVSSPIRNALIPPERGAMRFTLTRTGRVIGALLRRAVRAPDTRPGMEIVRGPLFSNNLCVLTYRGSGVELDIEHYEPDDDGQPRLAEHPRVTLA